MYVSATVSSSSSRRRARACSCSAANVATPAADTVLRGLIAEVSGVPADDVELVHACGVCGARHGRVNVPYPLTATGASWYADVAVSGDTAVAAAATRHPLGVGMEVATLDAGAGDRRGRVPRERARRPRRARTPHAARWCGPPCGRARPRSCAPSGTPTSSSRRGSRCPSRRRRRHGRIVRSVPEFGSAWRLVRFHDVPVPGNRAASVAVIG